MERSLFTLDGLRSGELRRGANAGLNKGEARNTLARAVAFRRLGELRDHLFENQAFRALALNLLVGAIISWNTHYLQAAFDALAARGAAVPPDLMRHVARFEWEHISLTGADVWVTDAQPGLGPPRPLRDGSSLLAAWVLYQFMRTGHWKHHPVLTPTRRRWRRFWRDRRSGKPRR